MITDIPFVKTHSDPAHHRVVKKTSLEVKPLSVMLLQCLITPLTSPAILLFFHFQSYCLVEMRGFEPLTSAVQRRRSPN